MNKFKLNLRINIVGFFVFILFSALFFNSYAKNNDEKNAISKELEYLSKGIKYDNIKSNNNIEFATKKENASKDTAINKELAYLNKNTNYKNKLKGQIYLKTDVGFLKSQPNVYKDNFCINECDNKGYTTGRNYNFGIGWYINNDYRLDLLYNKANLKFDYTQQKNTKIHYKHKVNISTLMLNLYRYKSISKHFDLYIGGGVGYTRVSPEDGILTANNQQAIYSANPSNNFSYGLATGISFKVNDNAELNLGYRFLNYGKVGGFDSVSVFGDNIPKKYKNRGFPDVKSGSLRGHNVSLSIIYKLPNSVYKKPY